MNKLFPALTIFCLFVLNEVVVSQEFVAGTSYLDDNEFVAYHAGNLPIIISIPHGGSLSPDSIQDRDCVGCVSTMDSWTQTIGEGVADRITEALDCYPHVVTNLLHRRKFDANRDIEDAADGNASVEQSWLAYHEYIDSAKARIMQEYGRGLFLDIHGHAHVIQRIELGYLLSGEALRQSDTALDDPSLLSESSIQLLASDNRMGLRHSDLLRGPFSLGSMLTTRGLPSVPGMDDPAPAVGDPYFTGGYNTQRHGSRDGDITDAIQIEMNQEIRFDEEKRERLMDSLASAVMLFVDQHYIDLFSTRPCSQISSTEYVSDNSSLRLFPNPAYDRVIVETDNVITNLRIMDGMGQHVYETAWDGRPIDISQLSSGCYIVVAEVGEGQSQVVVMIKK